MILGRLSFAKRPSQVLRDSFHPPGSQTVKPSFKPPPNRICSSDTPDQTEGFLVTILFSTWPHTGEGGAVFADRRARERRSSGFHWGSFPPFHPLPIRGHGREPAQPFGRQARRPRHESEQGHRKGRLFQPQSLQSRSQFLGELGVGIPPLR